MIDDLKHILYDEGAWKNYYEDYSIFLQISSERIKRRRISALYKTKRKTIIAPELRKSDGKTILS